MKRFAVLFSGQGSQYVGMGKKLFERDGSTRALFETASQTLGIDMAHLCFEGKAEDLNRTENTQPALLLCSVADYLSFRTRTGLTPAFMAGHSLGELSALVASEAISLEDGLRLARARGLAMSRCGMAGKAGMHAVTKLEQSKVEQVCSATSGFRSEFVLANLNAPGQFVLSGSLAGLDSAGAALKEAGGTIIPLRVSGPFHSPFMAKAAEEFAAVIANIKLQQPQVPVVANINARLHGAPADIVQALVQQITSPVLWSDTMKLLQREGVEVYLEAGPGEVLKKLALSNISLANAFALDQEADRLAIEHLFGADIRAMKERPSVVGKCMAIAVCTQNNNWNEDEYQSGVVEPYRQLKSMQERLEHAGEEPTTIDMRQALDYLGQIFATKGAAQDERNWRLTQIIESTGTQDVLSNYSFHAAA